MSESRSQLKPTVSVVIPAYNAEDTIGDTLASVMAQTLPGVEVVVVDDSSSDYTSAVVDDFIERCPEIRLIRNQKNLGAHDSRVNGVKAAKADLVGFVDADDLVAPTMFETLVKSLTKEDGDIAVCGYFVSTERGYVPALKFAESEIVTQDVLDRFARLDFGFGSMCNKLYKRDLLLKGEVGFPWRQDSHEDMLWNISCFRYAKKVCLLKSVLYYYNRNRAGSATNAVDKPEALANHFAAYALAVGASGIDDEEISSINRLFKKTFGVRAYQVESLSDLETHRESLQQSISHIAGKPEAIVAYMTLDRPPESSTKAQLNRVIVELQNFLNLFGRMLVRRLTWSGRSR